jgi:hypothetical protein
MLWTKVSRNHLGGILLGKFAQAYPTARGCGRQTIREWQRSEFLEDPCEVRPRLRTAKPRASSGGAIANMR